MLEPTLDVRKAITATIRQFKPDVVISPCPERNLSMNVFVQHPDHLAVLIPRRVLVYAPAFILLVFALTAWERNGGRIGWRWLEVLGDASYSIYLIHASALAALFYLTMLVN